MKLGTTLLTITILGASLTLTGCGGGKKADPAPTDSQPGVTVTESVESHPLTPGTASPTP